MDKEKFVLRDIQSTPLIERELGSYWRVVTDSTHSPAVNFAMLELKKPTVPKRYKTATEIWVLQLGKVLLRIFKEDGTLETVETLEHNGTVIVIHPGTIFQVVPIFKRLFAARVLLVVLSAPAWSEQDEETFTFPGFRMT